LRVLINAIGISDSGGVVVLEKLIKELIVKEKDNKFTFLVTTNPQINTLTEKYKQHRFFEFRSVSFKNYLSRLLYENISCREIIIEKNINLVYNFSGSRQFFVKTPQLIKVHNLLFYSKKLDRFYRKNFHIILWFKHVFFKGLVFRFMLDRSNFLEIQSKHVSSHLSDFVDIRKKQFYIKSDVDVRDQSFEAPRKYDFSKKIKILYIVGPHFEYPHKNILDFTRAMLELKKVDIDFEINITLTSDQLNRSEVWDESLNSLTNFRGYIPDSKDMEELFCDNTILISTSIIETLGLHVIEAIKNGVVAITPSEDYAIEVYGGRGFGYDLFDPDSLCRTVVNIISDNKPLTNLILNQQQYLRQNEMVKLNNIVDVFDDVLSRQS